MHNIPILDTQFKVVDHYEINDLFDIEPNHKIMSEVVRWQLANRRVCTQSVKNRSMVSGAHRKLWRQKGTGRARQGDGKACHFRGGGACFKLMDREYSFKLNKKFKKLALRMAITERRDHICLVQDLMNFDLTKTKSCSNFVQSVLSLNEKKVKKILFLTDTDTYKNTLPLLRGSKNLYNVSVMPVANFNVLASTQAAIVMDVKSMKTLEERLS